MNSQSVQVGSNGVITFTPQPFPGNCNWPFTQTIPNATFPIRNAIYGVYQDINPSTSTAPVPHSINYQVLGTAPCRSFVVNFYNIAQFSCGTSVGLQTSQIVLYETSNIVEVYVQDRTVCSGWNSGSGLIGIQNAAGTQAHVPPGRNTGPWEAQNEAWRFTPDGDSNVIFQWRRDGEIVPEGPGVTDINVCFTETTLMTAEAIYTGCGGTVTTKTVDILLRVNEIDVAPIEDVVSCECYLLPDLLVGNYFTEPGGLGEQIPAGTPICENMTLYVYAATLTTPSCTDEESFTLVIGGIEAPAPTDISECVSYTLPDLGNPAFNYYTGLDGTGTMYTGLGGDVITETTVLYIYGQVGDCISQSSFTITIGAIQAPVLPDVTDCTGFTLPALPANTTYNDAPGGTGTTIAVGTFIGTTQTIYIFAQNGDCTGESSFTVTVDNAIVPEFDQAGPFCLNAPSVTLPSTANNLGIAGIWTPSAIVDTTVAGSFTYTFTPDGVVPCAVVTTMVIEIQSEITPTFVPLADICINGVAPELPQPIEPTIVGTWNPLTIDTSAVGTFTFTFTPDVNINPCAVPATLTVNVISTITPTFDPIANICENTTIPALPNVSTNGLSGTWSPATINPIPGTNEYCFTPDPINTCAAPVCVMITVDPEIVPVFAPIADICVGGIVPILSLVSDNGLTGTWSPAIIDPSVAGPIQICFTPNPGQGCTVQYCTTVNITAPADPVFTLPSTVCFGDVVPLLPTTSGTITGTWSPTAIDNTLSQVYIFTPDAGQCANSYSINITVLPAVTPTFTQIADFCSGTTAPVLPTTSNNPGNPITGIWSPDTVSNQTSGTYTFTPAAGQCAVSVSMTINVIQTITPTFAPVATICPTDIAPVLPTTSNNPGNPITGIWSPATVSTTETGTYTFTPDAGQPCATIQTLTVTVSNPDAFVLQGGCNGSDYVLTGFAPDGFSNDATFTWYDSSNVIIPGATTESIIVTATGNYKLVVTSGGCPSEASFNVTGINCGIQKGISPGDGNDNDFFDLSGQNVRQLEIFNRYGTKVYSQVNYSREWYGQSDKGDELPDGTYFYVIERDNVATKTGWIYINRVK